MAVLKNWRILILIVCLLAALGLILFKGLSYGVDFSGGTLFQIQLEEAATPQQMSEQILPIIQKRLDFTGLRDTTVSSTGTEFITAQIAESDPGQIKQLQDVLLKQGKFESTLEGQLLFDGSGILEITKDATRGYGIQKLSDSAYEWHLPFTLSDDAAQSFTTKTFHQCTRTSFTETSQSSYDCKDTFFFIDRPSNSILVAPASLIADDTTKLSAGNFKEGYPAGVKLDDVVLNAQLKLLQYSGDALDGNALAQLQSAKDSGIKFAVIPDSTSQAIQDQLMQLNFKIKKVPLSTRAWLIDATGLREVISLSADVTNVDPYVADVKDARILSSLVIRGTAPSLEEAQLRLKSLAILLESGSLPIAIQDISVQSVSPALGQAFLFTVGFMGLIALIVVALVLFIRYRTPKVAIPILITGISEILLILGFASLIGWKLDLASMAGIIGAVGTGVDSQIIITDEMLKGVKEEQTNLLSKIKKAFFVIFASASTIIAVLLPMIIVGLGLGKITGFAITTIAGVLMGIFITRPAFGEVMKIILEKKA